MSFDGKSYSHSTPWQLINIKEKYNVNEDVDTYQSLLHKLMLTQINAKKGIKIFVERAIVDMFKEYNQLDDEPMPGKPVVAPFNPYGLTPHDGKKKIEAVNLSKEKHCGKIKVRTCANGIKQRKVPKPDEIIYSPTCSTEALMTALVINAIEQRDVAIFDVPRAFLQTAQPADKFLSM